MIFIPFPFLVFVGIVLNSERRILQYQACAVGVKFMGGI